MTTMLLPTTSRYWCEEALRSEGESESSFLAKTLTDFNQNPTFRTTHRQDYAATVESAFNEQGTPDRYFPQPPPRS